MHNIKRWHIVHTSFVNYAPLWNFSPRMITLHMTNSASRNSSEHNKTVQKEFNRIIFIPKNAEINKNFEQFSQHNRIVRPNCHVPEMHKTLTSRTKCTHILFRCLLNRKKVKTKNCASEPIPIALNSITNKENLSATRF